MHRKAGVVFLFFALFVLVGCSGGRESNRYTSSSYATRRPFGEIGSGGVPAATTRPMSPRGGAALFRLPNLNNGQEAVGGPALLFFLTSWCGYCKQVLPEFNRIADRARSQGWRVYGIMVGEGVEQAGGFVTRYRPDFPVLSDQHSMVSKQYGVKGYPTFVIVNGDGAVQYNAHELPRNF